MQAKRDSKVCGGRSRRTGSARWTKQEADGKQSNLCCRDTKIMFTAFSVQFFCRQLSYSTARFARYACLSLATTHHDVAVNMYTQLLQKCKHAAASKCGSIRKSGSVLVLYANCTRLVQPVRASVIFVQNLETEAMQQTKLLRWHLNTNS